MHRIGLPPWAHMPPLEAASVGVGNPAFQSIRLGTVLELNLDAADVILLYALRSEP